MLVIIGESISAIVGGEAGPGARPLEQVWVTEIRDQCLRAHVPFFFKQWDGTNKKKAGRELEGRMWDEMPVGDAGEKRLAMTDSFDCDR